MKINVLAVVATVSLLAACSQKGEPDAVAAPAAEASATAEAATPASTAVDPTFSVDPASMTSCDSVIATVKWDIRTEHPAVSEIEILVGPDSAPTLFAASGNYGEIKTGPWTAPGETFRLRDKATGLELERLVVTGPACN